MEQKICISCKKKVVNDPGCVTFLCPSCGKHTLTRCGSCRIRAIKYVCPQCGFTGPN